MSTILFADDNPHAQRMGSQILSQEGHSVITVSDGDQAMEYLAENQVDLVMADTRMPGPSGFEICRHIRSAPEHENVKMVLLAGPLEPFDASRAEEVGCDGVLHKPLDAYSLLDTVKSLLGDTGEVDDESDSAAQPANGAPAPKPAKASAPPAPKPAPAPRAATATPAAAASFSDELTALVEQTLTDPAGDAAREVRVRQAVKEVLDAALPALVEQVTRKVLASLREK